MKCLAQGHNIMTLSAVTLELAVLHGRGVCVCVCGRGGGGRTFQLLIPIGTYTTFPGGGVQTSVPHLNLPMDCLLSSANTLLITS